MEVGNMEAASFNARRAASAILDRAGSREPRATVVGVYRPQLATLVEQLTPPG
jgi:hypothetical protein